MGGAARGAPTNPVAGSALRGRGPERGLPAGASQRAGPDRTPGTVRVMLQQRGLGLVSSACGQRRPCRALQVLGITRTHPDSRALAARPVSDAVERAHGCQALLGAVWTLLWLNCAPAEGCVGVLTPSTQKVTLFGDRIFTEVTNNHESLGRAPNPSTTGVLVSRRPGEGGRRENSEMKGAKRCIPPRGAWDKRGVPSIRP